MIKFLCFYEVTETYVAEMSQSIELPANANDQNLPHTETCDARTLVCTVGLDFLFSGGMFNNK